MPTFSWVNVLEKYVEIVPVLEERFDQPFWLPEADSVQA